MERPQRDHCGTQQFTAFQTLNGILLLNQFPELFCRQARSDPIAYAGAFIPPGQFVSRNGAPGLGAHNPGGLPACRLVDRSWWPIGLPAEDLSAVVEPAPLSFTSPNGV